MRIILTVGLSLLLTYYLIMEEVIPPKALEVFGGLLTFSVLFAFVDFSFRRLHEKL